MRLKVLLILMSLSISLIPIGIIGGFNGFEIVTVSLGLILIVSLIVSFFMAYFITRPIQKLMKKINEISRGNLDISLEKSEIYEINNLINSLKRVMVSLKLAIRKVGIMKEDIFKETLKEKDAAESRYTSLLKVVDGWIWEIDNNGVWQFSSEKITDILGYQPSEIVGKNIYNFLETKDKNKLKKIFKQHIIKSSENENFPVTIDLSFQHKGGNNVSLHSSIVPFYDESFDFLGFRGMNRIINDVYQEKTDLIEKTTPLKNEELIIPVEKEDISGSASKNILVSSMGDNKYDYCFLFDKDTNIVECSEDMPQKLGYDKSEILSLTLDELDCFEKKESIKKKLNSIKDSGKLNFKTMYKKKNNSTILVNETICYLKDKDLFECSVNEEKYSK
jgi:PAS domain S-box-containing protein